MNTKAVNTDRLTWGFNGKKILEDISISVPRGSFTGIIGPNGAGKTTMLKLILRLLSPEKNTVFIQSEDITSLTRNEIARKESYVSQTLSMDLGFTVEQIVAMGRNPYMAPFSGETDKDSTAIKKALHDTQTEYLKNKYINRISGGELQRVIIARALAQEPDILALDEPTNHLDLNHQIKTLSLIRELACKENITVLAVLHDFNHALEYCDNLIFLNEGKVEAYGCPAEVISPAIMKRIYHLEVVIQKNPFTGKPYMMVNR